MNKETDNNIHVKLNKCIITVNFCRTHKVGNIFADDNIVTIVDGKRTKYCR